MELVVLAAVVILFADARADFDFLLRRYGKQAAIKQLVHVGAQEEAVAGAVGSVFFECLDVRGFERGQGFLAGDSAAAVVGVSDEDAERALAEASAGEELRAVPCDGFGVDLDWIYALLYSGCQRNRVKGRLIPQMMGLGGAMRIMKKSFFAALVCWPAILSTSGWAVTDIGFLDVDLAAPAVVGQQTIVNALVKNFGSTTIGDCVVTMTLPQGSQFGGWSCSFVDSSDSSGRDIIFHLSNIAPGVEWFCNLNFLIPQTEGPLVVPLAVGIPGGDDNPANDTVDFQPIVTPAPSYLPDLSVEWSPATKAPRATVTVVPWETVYHVRGTVRVNNLLPYATPSTGTIELWLTHDDTVNGDDHWLATVPVPSIKPRRSRKIKIAADTYYNPEHISILAAMRDPDRAPADNASLSLPVTVAVGKK